MAQNQALYNLLKKGLVQRGARANLADWGAAQCMHESNHGTSNVAKNCNNYGGIVYAKKPGTTPCSNKQPGADGGRGYAAYKSIGAFLDDYVRVLKLKPAKPWDAKSLDDFVNRLAMNCYFGCNKDHKQPTAQAKQNYRAGVSAMLKTYTHNPTPHAKPPGPLQRKTAVDKAQARSQAHEDVRTGLHKQREKEFEDSKNATSWDKFKAWFEGLSAIEKALFLGAGGFLVHRFIDR